MVVVWRHWVWRWFLGHVIMITMNWFPTTFRTCLGTARYWTEALNNKLRTVLHAWSGLARMGLQFRAMERIGLLGARGHSSWGREEQTLNLEGALWMANYTTWSLVCSHREMMTWQLLFLLPVLMKYLGSQQGTHQGSWLIQDFYFVKGVKGIEKEKESRAQKCKIQE